MENQTPDAPVNIEKDTKVVIPKSLTTVTKLSKAVALTLFIALPFIGFVLGYKYHALIDGVDTNTQESITQATSSPTPSPAQPNIPQVGPNTKLIEPDLVSTADWKVISFPQDITIGQGGNTRKGNIEMMIPSDWGTKTVQERSGQGIGGACNDFHINSADNNTVLVIKPSCGDSNNDYIPISGQVQKVRLITNKGNDGHDSHTVRYFDPSLNIYHYGSIGVYPPGTKIDVQKEQIYPNLTLQYEPDRSEQWLWTSYDLTYTGPEDGQQAAISIVDTVISTLLLSD